MAGLPLAGLPRWRKSGYELRCWVTPGEGDLREVPQKKDRHVLARGKGAVRRTACGNRTARVNHREQTR